MFPLEKRSVGIYVRIFEWWGEQDYGDVPPVGISLFLLRYNAVSYTESKGVRGELEAWRRLGEK